MTSNRRPPAPIVVLLGLAAGVVWGVLARGWMRFISDDPGFSWSGTLFIVGSFGVAAMLQSVAHVVRRRGLAGWRLGVVRVITGAGLLPLCSGPAIFLFPTVVLGGAAWAHPLWRSWVRALLGVIAVVPVIGTAVPLFSDLPLWRAVLGSAGLVVVYGGVVWAAAGSFAPGPEPVGGRLPSHRPAVRWAVAIPVALGLAAAVLMTTGF